MTAVVVVAVVAAVIVIAWLVVDIARNPEPPNGQEPDARAPRSSPRPSDARTPQNHPPAPQGLSVAVSGPRPIPLSRDPYLELADRLADLEDSLADIGHDITQHRHHVDLIATPMEGTR